MPDFQAKTMLVSTLSGESRARASYFPASTQAVQQGHGTGATSFYWGSYVSQPIQYVATIAPQEVFSAGPVFATISTMPNDRKLLESYFSGRGNRQFLLESVARSITTVDDVIAVLHHLVGPGLHDAYDSAVRLLARKSAQTLAAAFSGLIDLRFPQPYVARIWCAVIDALDAAQPGETPPTKIAELFSVLARHYRPEVRAASFDGLSELAQRNPYLRAYVESTLHFIRESRAQRLPFHALSHEDA